MLGTGVGGVLGMGAGARVVGVLGMELVRVLETGLLECW